MFHNKWETNVNNYKVFQQELCFYGKILLRGNRIVIPKKLVWWPKIDNDVDKIVKSGKGCMIVAAPYFPQPMKRRSQPTEPWVDVSVDFVGPLPSAVHMFIITDYFIGFKEIKISRDISGRKPIEIMKEFFSRLGTPKSITCDNGKQCANTKFRNFSNENDIRIFHTIPYWPQQNGEVEKQDRDILKSL